MTALAKSPRNFAGDMIPLWLQERLAEFILDKRTGNLILHVKSGQVLGGKLEEVLTKD